MNLMLDVSIRILSKSLIDWLLAQNESSISSIRNTMLSFLIKRINSSSSENSVPMFLPICWRIGILWVALMKKAPSMKKCLSSAYLIAALEIELLPTPG